MTPDVIFNERCETTMERMMTEGFKVDLLLTSPPYNTNKKQGRSLTIQNSKTSLSKSFNTIRYDTVIDSMTNDEYAEWTCKLFRMFYDVVYANGVVLYNMSYGNENTGCMIHAVDSILMKTQWSLGDIICWKKKNAMPNNQSPNRLSRIMEFVYVFFKTGHEKTFHANKTVTSVRDTGQKMYSSTYNFIEARNNDCSCPYNKATFSSELVEKLLALYGVNGGVVYDPFMGSGTTAVGALRYGMHYVGSEISENQCIFARERIAKVLSDL